MTALNGSQLYKRKTQIISWLAGLLQTKGTHLLPLDVSVLTNLMFSLNLPKDPVWYNGTLQTSDLFVIPWLRPRLLRLFNLWPLNKTNVTLILFFFLQYFYFCFGIVPRLTNNANNFRLSNFIPNTRVVSLKRHLLVNIPFTFNLCHLYCGYKKKKKEN